MTFVLFAIVIMLAGALAQHSVRSQFARYSQIRIRRGLTGKEIARQILNAHNLYEVKVERSKRGQLSDHYDPQERILRLSSDAWDTPSIAAAGIAAHEAGHAIQHAQAYLPLEMRTSLVPTVAIGTRLAPIILLGGSLLALFGIRHFGIPLALLGLILYILVAVLALITVPVEIDASLRARQLLSDHQIVERDELDGVSDVLRAAAWTYVVGALAAISQVLLMLGRRR